MLQIIAEELKLLTEKEALAGVIEGMKGLREGAYLSGSEFDAPMIKQDSTGLESITAKHPSRRPREEQIKIVNYYLDELILTCKRCLDGRRIGFIKFPPDGANKVDPQSPERKREFELVCNDEFPALQKKIKQLKTIIAADENIYMAHGIGELLKDISDVITIIAHAVGNRPVDPGERRQEALTVAHLWKKTAWEEINNLYKGRVPENSTFVSRLVNSGTYIFTGSPLPR